MAANALNLCSIYFLHKVDSFVAPVNLYKDLHQPHKEYQGSRIKISTDQIKNPGIFLVEYCIFASLRFLIFLAK